MANDPETLLLHTVAASHWADTDSIRTAVEEAIPDLDLRVARTPPESREMIESADIVLSAFLPRSLLDAAENLRLIQALSAGVDFYPLDAIRERDIVVTNAAGIHAEPIAEQVFGYLLMFERGIHRGMRQQSQHVWQRYEGGEVRGKTLGIVGVGEIGSRVASYGQSFGMTVVGTKRNTETAPDTVDEIYPADELFEVLKRSDYVVVACPLTDETRGLLGQRELTAMKSSSVLVNVARGEIVEQDALEHVLQQRIIRGAAIDVYAEEPFTEDSPLWDLPNVVMTPHMAGSTPFKSERIADIFATNYRAYVDEDPDSYTNRVI